MVVDIGLQLARLPPHGMDLGGLDLTGTDSDAAAADSPTEAWLSSYDFYVKVWHDLYVQFLDENRLKDLYLTDNIVAFGYKCSDLAGRDLIHALQALGGLCKQTPDCIRTANMADYLAFEVTHMHLTVSLNDELVHFTKQMHIPGVCVANPCLEAYRGGGVRRIYRSSG